MNRENGRGFHFGLEAEYLLVDAETFRPLWHPDLSFDELNAAFEAIPVGDLPPLDGLDLEPPHRRLMPFAVEGYHLPAPNLGPRLSRRGGGSQQHGRLDHPTEQYVGQRLHGSRADGARVHGCLQRELHETEPVALVDLAPALPSEDGWPFQQCDAAHGRVEASVEERIGALAQHVERVTNRLDG